LGEKHPLLATSLNNWVRLLQGKGDYAGAEKYYSQALTLLEENKAGEGWSAAKIQANLCVLQLDRGDYAAAERYSRQALELRRKVSAACKAVP